jgi:hypothetical protein
MSRVDEQARGSQKGTPEIFSQMESQGVCDGFLWPYEAGRLEGFCWADGERAVRYETVKGILFLRHGAWRYYGFEAELDFVKAARRAALGAESEKGVLTLGALRAYPAGNSAVYLVVPDSPVKLQFPVATPSEEAGVTTVLSKNFPGCKIFAGGKFLGGVHFPTGSFWESFRVSMGGPWKRDVLFLMSIALSSIVFILYGFVNRDGFLGGLAVGFMFVLLLLRFSQKVEQSRRGEGSESSGNSGRGGVEHH